MTRTVLTSRRRPVFRRRWPVAFALLALSCGSGDDDIPEGGECQVCRSSEPKCDAGMTCTRFQGNFTYSLCAKPTTTSCPVPFSASPLAPTSPSRS